MASILVVDDDQALCRSLELQLSASGHEVSSVHRVEDGVAACRALRPSIVFCDLLLPDGSGLDVLREILRSHPDCIVVMITGVQDARATIEAIRRGAFDYIRKPLDLDNVRLVLEKAQSLLERERGNLLQVGDGASGNSRDIVGAAPSIIEVIKEIGILSTSRVSVLIEGESGTGKELAARALHDSSRPGRPFVAVNCSAIVSTLLESELFGHEKGAFTGADSAKKGKLELAGEGTIFFDEIGDMSLDLQAKLLRTLQEREFERVGGNDSIALNARVVAATNRPIDGLVRTGKFREDLAYRLGVSRIRIPPLRERRDDIPLLVRHLLGRIGGELHRPIDSIEETALEVLQAHDWPGNVRELENVLTRAALLQRDRVITREAVERALGKLASREAAPAGEIVPLRESEKRHVLAALQATGWNITQTARALEISPTTLRKKIQDHGLEKKVPGT